MRTSPLTDETQIASRIVSVLPAGSVARELAGDRDTIRFAVRSALKLRTIVLKRSSLRRLIDDPAREVKIEYLQRDLLETSGRRCEFRYPRLSHLAASSRTLCRRALGARLLASVVSVM